MMAVVGGNPAPSSVSSCMYSSIWSQKEINWIVREQGDFFATQVTAPLGPSLVRRHEDDEGALRGPRKMPQPQPLREKNGTKGRGYKHVPHKDKPAQVVAKRNARERRRVQAVNSAFVRLRKAVPHENTRGKRISKVKTLQNAIDYIYNLQQLLEHSRGYQPAHVMANYYSHRVEDFQYNFDFEDEF